MNNRLAQFILADYGYCIGIGVLITNLFLHLCSTKFSSMKNLIVLFFFVPLFASAQKTHVVKPKETLYSLARLYNIHPRELAAYNNIPVGTGLTLGQVIKIPANPTMAPLGAAPEKKEEETKKEPEVKKDPIVKKEPEVKSEPITKTTAPTKKPGSDPVYHKVAKKETLYHISKVYNITIEDIKKWNKISTDGVSEGTNLIVGYGNDVVAKPVETVKETKPAETKPVVKESPKTTEPEKKEADKVVKTEPLKKETVRKEEVNNVTGKDFKGGVFKSVYDKQVNDKDKTAEEKGLAGIFKSTSGWEDGKYYCLTNSAPPGSIVKITNPANQHSIYAKVLDLIPDLKQNAGLVIRISNAAASELGATSDNFESIINY